MDNDTIIMILGPIIAAVGAYAVAKRTTSGDIDTSDAATLWAESQAIRKELRDEVNSLREEVTKLRKEISDLEKEKTINHQKIVELVEKIKKLEHRLTKLGGEI